MLLSKCGVFFGGDEHVVKLGSEDGRTTLRIY